MEHTVVSRKQAIERGLPRYFTGKPCKHGHVSERQCPTGTCITCQRLYDKSEERRAPRPRDMEHLREWCKNHYSTHKTRLYRKYREYYAANKSKVNKQGGKRRKERYAEDSQFRIKINSRSRLTSACRNQRTKKSNRTFELTGCTFKELIEHLESKFLPGMTLDNYGEWQIDHIIPCASFDLRCPLQQRLCFGFWNLQPLWVEDHKLKSVEDVRSLRA